MPITVTCPSCAGRFRAPDGTEGKTTRCPKCREPLVIPKQIEVTEADIARPEVDIARGIQEWWHAAPAAPMERPGQIVPAQSYYPAEQPSHPANEPPLLSEVHEQSVMDAEPVVRQAGQPAIPKKTPGAQSPPPSTMLPAQSGQNVTKPCSYCGEQILAIAIKCKHCGEMLHGSREKAPTAHPIPAGFRCIHCGSDARPTKYIDSYSSENRSLIMGMLLLIVFSCFVLLPLILFLPFMLHRSHRCSNCGIKLGGGSN